MADPFLNWLVDIMLESSPSRRPIFATVLRGANPAQTPGYYRTVSLPVSNVQGRDSGSKDGDERLLARAGPAYPQYSASNSVSIPLLRARFAGSANKGSSMP